MVNLGPVGFLILNERRRYWLVLLALVLVQLVLIWWLPVIPGQDLPEHLTYARVLLDYDRSDLRFQELYALAPGFSPYHATHWILVGLAKVSSLDAAVRFIMSAYAIAMALSFHALVHAVERPSAGVVRWTGLLGVALVWNPVVLMGFLGFVITIPMIVGAFACVLRWSSGTGRRRHVILALVLAALISTLHIIAGAGLIAVVGLFAAFRRDRRTVIASLAVIGVVIAVQVLWMTLVANELAERGADWDRALRGARGLDAVTSALQITWYDPAIKTSYALWTVLGPFRWTGLVFVAAIIVALIAIVRRAGRGEAGEAPSARAVALRRALYGAAALSWLAPWGMEIPTEVKFIDLRLMTVVFALWLAQIDPRWFAPRRARAALIAAVVLVVGHASYRLIGFAGEARPVLALLQQGRSEEVLLPLAFHPTSAHFARQFRVFNYLPLYHTVRGGGITTSFWAGYVARMPVRHRPGPHPEGPPDWAPQQVSPSHLRTAELVLLNAPTDEDPREVQGSYNATRKQLDERFDRLDCAGPWCLYRARPRAEEPAVPSGPAPR